MGDKDKAAEGDEKKESEPEPTEEVLQIHVESCHHRCNLFASLVKLTGRPRDMYRYLARSAEQVFWCCVTRGPRSLRSSSLKMRSARKMKIQSQNHQSPLNGLLRMMISEHGSASVGV